MIRMAPSVVGCISNTAAEPPPISSSGSKPSCGVDRRQQEHRGKFEHLLGLKGDRPQLYPARGALKLQTHVRHQRKQGEPHRKGKKVRRERPQPAVVYPREEQQRDAAADKPQQQLRYRHGGKGRAPAPQEPERRGGKDNQPEKNQRQKNEQERSIN